MECSDLLYNLGLRLFKGSEDNAMDLLHDTYVLAKDAYHTYKGEAKFSTWIYSIATRLGLNKIKRRGIFEIKFSEKDDINWIENILDEKYLSSSEKLVEEEEHKYIQMELNKLPDSYRIPLVLFYYEGLSYGEIAQNLDEKESTIKSYIFRGKAILRKKIKL